MSLARQQRLSDLRVFAMTTIGRERLTETFNAIVTVPSDAALMSLEQKIEWVLATEFPEERAESLVEQFA